MTNQPEPNTNQENFDKAVKFAADWFVYAPVGLARQLSQNFPSLVQSGREALQTPLTAAKIMGKYSVDQQRKDLGEKLRKATEPYFGVNGSASDESPAAPSAPASADGAEATTNQSPAAAKVRVKRAPSASTAKPQDDTIIVSTSDVGALPIEGYATLSATQVLSHLESLSLDQLAEIEAFEQAGRARKTILGRIALLRSAS